jgi:hypothetical protein
MDQRLAEIEKMRAEEAALTTPQRLDRMVMKMAERAARRQAELQAHVAAIKQFYAALTPSQQKAFDALHGGMMGGMGGMGGMGDEPGGRKMHLGLIDGPAPSLPPIPPLAVRAPRSPAPLAPPLPPEPPLPAY